LNATRLYPLLERSSSESRAPTPEMEPTKVARAIDQG
jgi:hypothetical protein